MATAIGLGRPSPASAGAHSVSSPPFTRGTAANTSCQQSPRATHRHPRQSSQAAYSVFDAGQIQIFKEAFSVRVLARDRSSSRDLTDAPLQLIDADNDGMISENDLKSLLTSLGERQ